MNIQEPEKQTSDQIPQANTTTKQVVGLVKEGGRLIFIYKLFLLRSNLPFPFLDHHRQFSSHSLRVLV